MSTELELLWTAVLLLLLLGVAASLCVRCSRPGPCYPGRVLAGMKKPEKIYEQRSLQENQQSFAVTRTYSLARQAWPGSALDSAPDSAQTRKDKLLQFSPGVEGSASPRYQNFSKGSRQESDAAYIDPITVDYYNWEPFQKPLEAPRCDMLLSQTPGQRTPEPHGGSLACIRAQLVCGALPCVPSAQEDRAGARSAPTRKLPWEDV
ncbi:linker for activation of T-cells family member 2 isoform X5 [Loxodonta africana]|uniref:linker for activation of T-cells family member 2 isoform X5 n=1 Tax=Loxodonta africana TaxID=9785 RepID=UPI000C814740|nr:linker for activation of T-cells family member 2 isoform X5 [Loxodonta africana]